MRTTIVAVIFLMALPAQAHTWFEAWHAEVVASGGLTVSLVDEWREHRQLILPPQARSTAGNARRQVSPSVEAWRPLVEAWWPQVAVDEALRVMQCESKGDPHADNPYSTASGLFQFLQGTWDWVADQIGLPTYTSGAVYDPVLNVRAAAWLYSQRGWRPWVCQP